MVKSSWSKGQVGGELLFTSLFFPKELSPLISFFFLRRKLDDSPQTARLMTDIAIVKEN